MVQQEQAGLALEHLAELAGQGDRRAAEVLLQELRPWIERVIGRTRFDRDEVQDITQDALDALARALRSYQPPRPVKPWAITIVRNVCASYVRSDLARRRREDTWEARRARLHDGADLAAELDFLLAFRSCCSLLASEVRQELLWSRIVLGMSIGELERQHPDIRWSVRRWVDADLKVVYRCVYPDAPPSKEHANG